MYRGYILVDSGVKMVCMRDLFSDVERVSIRWFLKCEESINKVVCQM